jgi:type I restriction enzyme S subunit
MNRYESYEKTSLDWVPEIPEHWSLTRSKFIFRNKSVKNCPDEPLLSVTQKDGVVLRSESDLNVWNPTEDVSGYKLIEPSNFVISLRSFEGGLELSTIKGIVSPAYTVLEKTKKINDPYFRWLMKSYQFIIELNKHVTGIRQGKNIGWDDFSNIYLTVPPIEEQKLISRYLDKKTSQIDSLVEKIQKKIELLKEQRTSLINHYVTKGLHPNVEMKDSGVEWIGEIPKHWTMTKLGYLGTCSNGVSRGSEYFGEGHPFITYGDVYKNDVIPRPSGLCLSEEKDWETYSVLRGDIFFTRTSETNDDIGVSSVCLETIEKCSFSGFIIRFRPSGNRLNPNFSRFYFRSTFPKIHFTKEMNQVTRSSLSQGLLKTCDVPIPPLEEQQVIASYLQKFLEKIDVIVNSETERCRLLREYRQSLISSVVTGKVRVTEDMI